MKSLIPFALMIAAATLSGCSQQPAETTGDSGNAPSTAAATATINHNCPIMGSPVTDDGGRYDWNGKNVGFCCPECIEAFADMSDEEKTAAIAEADDSTGDSADDHSHDHSHDHGEPEAS